MQDRVWHGRHVERLAPSAAAFEPEQPDYDHDAAEDGQSDSAFRAAHHQLSGKPADDHDCANHDADDPSHGGIMRDATEPCKLISRQEVRGQFVSIPSGN
jgi:hypothetical protein